MKKKRLSFRAVYLQAALIPAMLIGVLSLISCTATLWKLMIQDDFHKLEVACTGLKEHVESGYEGELDYDDCINFVDSYVDQEVYLTLFTNDVRFATSLRDDNNQRLEGTKMDSAIWKELQEKNKYEETNVAINGTMYNVVYLTVHDKDGNVVGATFAGIPSDTIKHDILSVIKTMMLTNIIPIILVIVIVPLLARSIYKVLENISKDIHLLADGDLTVSSYSDSSIREFNDIIESVQKLQNKLSDVICGIQNDMTMLTEYVDTVVDSTHQCNELSTNINLTSQDLSQGSEDMAYSIQTANESMGDIGKLMEDVTEASCVASEASNSVVDVSNEMKMALTDLGVANKHTIEIIDEVVTGITDSDKAIKEISKAVNAIEDIASQTNLLSLNASIEAARAGDAGRGFSVVAGEINTLALKSKESAMDIYNIVSNILQKSEHNMELAKCIKESADNESEVLTTVGDKFVTVIEDTKSSSECVTNVTNRLQDLDQIKNSVLTEMESLSAISEENAASSQTTSDTIRTMADNMNEIDNKMKETKNITEEIQKALEYFKTDK